MHIIELPTPLSSLAVADWWSIAAPDLERIANALIKPLPGGWVRRGDNYVRIGTVKYGAAAHTISEELAALSGEARRILGGAGPGTILRAAAFYHLRFECIHPLCEANGRIGRVILAGQLDQSLRLPASEALAGLQDWETDYKRLFATNDPPVMFELLLDLLGRITGVPPSPEASQLPASIEPLHPQKNIPKNVPRLHPEKGLVDPAAVKKFARQHRKPSGGNAFRKFF